MNKPFSEPKQAKPPKSGQLRYYFAVARKNLLALSLEQELALVDEAEHEL